jgi:hypothetical protein
MGVNVGEQGVGDLKAVALHEARVAEDKPGLAVGPDLAVVEEDDAGAELEDHLQVVSGDEPGVGERGEMGDERAAGLGIEVGAGLVEDEDLRPHHQHAGERG